MVAHLFQNYDTIYLRFFPRILVYLRFYSQVYDYFLTNAHIYAHKKKAIYIYKQACVCGVTESRRIRGTELYRQQNPLHVRWS